MSDLHGLRRHLYEQRARLPLRALRRRRLLQRQIALLGPLPPLEGGAGGAGVREPRRPVPPTSGPGRALVPPV